MRKDLSAHSSHLSIIDVQRWQDESTGHPEDGYVVKGVQFGFLMQYTGPPCLDAIGKRENHSSARQYPKKCGGIPGKGVDRGRPSGPTHPPPFHSMVLVQPSYDKAKGQLQETQSDCRPVIPGWWHHQIHSEEHSGWGTGHTYTPHHPESYKTSTLM